MFQNVRADMKRYSDLGGWYANLGFWIVLGYRFGVWAAKRRFLPIRILLQVIYRLLVLPWRLVQHVELPTRAEIGPGLRLPHAHSILLPPGAKIGSECTIYHEVTIGYGAKPGMPQLGDHVVVFCGARILGGITVGEHAHIGPNVVVSRDVKAGAMVMPPAPRSVPMAMTKAVLRGRAAAGHTYQAVSNGAWREVSESPQGSADGPPPSGAAPDAAQEQPPTPPDADD